MSGVLTGSPARLITQLATSAWGSKLAAPPLWMNKLATVRASWLSASPFKSICGSRQEASHQFFLKNCYGKPCWSSCTLVFLMPDPVLLCFWTPFVWKFPLDLKTHSLTPEPFFGLWLGVCPWIFPFGFGNLVSDSRILTWPLTWILLLELHLDWCTLDPATGSCPFPVTELLGKITYDSGLHLAIQIENWEEGTHYKCNA